MRTMRSTRLSSGSRRSRRHAGSWRAPPASRERPRHIKPGTASSTKRPSGRGCIDDILAPARHRYGPERWDLAEREGAELTVHDAIDLALERGRFARVATTTTAAAPR